MGKKEDKKIAEVTKVAETKDTTIIFKINRPVSGLEHESISKKIRAEEERSGVKIVLIPYTCDLAGVEE